MKCTMLLENAVNEKTSTSADIAANARGISAQLPVIVLQILKLQELVSS